MGSSERVAAACEGKGQKMIQPILDEITHMDEDDSLWEISGNGENAFVSSISSSLDAGNLNKDGDISAWNDRIQHQKGLCIGLDSDEACQVVLRAFRAAAEREISVGDGLDMWIVKRTDPMMRFGVADEDTNAYIVEKFHYSLPTH